ncbi:MAG: hypothetical protein CMI09_07470 [Oceanospirillaceae bacterium]|nr:hypothetical protein [Oceanospirillaceae bacterium]|tara:strand:+ start:828 stop:1118 length:291 start_codon:yes stop_codon:yes gene_type:complete
MSEREQTENRITLSLEPREACEEHQKIAIGPMRSELLEKEIFSQKNTELRPRSKPETSGTVVIERISETRGSTGIKKGWPSTLDFGVSGGIDPPEK